MALLDCASVARHSSAEIFKIVHVELHDHAMEAAQRKVITLEWKISLLRPNNHSSKYPLPHNHVIETENDIGNGYIDCYIFR